MTDIKVPLIGRANAATFGEHWPVVARTYRALVHAGEHELAAQFKSKAEQCTSYAEALALCRQYVEVS